MYMMTSQIFKLVDLSKAKKSKFLENKILFLFQIIKFIHCTLRVITSQKIGFLAQVKFKNDVQVLNRHPPLYTTAKKANFL